MANIVKRIVRTAIYVIAFIVGLLFWFVAQVINYPRYSSWMLFIPIVFVAIAFYTFKQIDKRKAEKEWDEGKAARIDAARAAQQDRDRQ